LLLVVIGQGLRVAFTSPRLRLQEVRVTGTRRLSPEEVTRLGHIRLGQNIFTINLLRISEQLMEEPAIQDAVVTRELPRTLAVDLKERVPAIHLLAKGEAPGSFQGFYADADGVVFERATTPQDKLPILEIPAADAPPIGRKLRPEWVRTVWDCERLAREARLGLRRMRVDGKGELWLNIEPYSAAQTPGRSLTVYIGRCTELPEKFRDVRQALNGWPDLPARAAYLNVMCAGSPSYGPLTENSASR
jgi:hypothetical protein